MHFLSYIRDLLIDFLFPRSQKTIELEALSTDTLTRLLPRAEPLKEKHNVALFDYSHLLVKEIIWHVKYKGNTRVADKLGEILYDNILHELADLRLFEKWDNPILVPMPISDKRRLERGWNQAELLAKQVMKRDQNKMFRYLPDQLLKLRHTESQTKTRSRKERLENLTNSMGVKDEERVSGECIVLIDDVTTTGSTFVEARRALRAAGAKKILCVAVAH